MHKKKDIINKWITKGIRISCKRKRTLYSLVKKSSDERLKLYYKRYCNILVKVIKEAKKLNYHKLINKSENKIQTTWKIIKKQIAKNQGIDNIPQIQLRNNEINNPTEILHAFNEYFITTAERLTTVNSAKREAIGLLDSFKADNITEMRLIPTT
jgi:hypothetical protein